MESAWTVGGGFTYDFWRNIALTLNYQYTATAANEAAVAVYNQNVFSAGMTYHY
jgi:opacity protein-like surface antigen